MATLTIPNLPEEAQRALQTRAARSGRSVEAEAGSLLEAALAREAEIESRVARAQAIVREAHGGVMPTGRVEAFLQERREAAERGE